MALLLTLRTEAVCFTILVFFFAFSMKYQRNEENRSFQRLNLFALGFVVCEALALLSANVWADPTARLSRLCHGIYSLFAILFCYEFLCYVVHLTRGQTRMKKVRWCLLAVPLAYALAIPFLPLSLHPEETFRYGSGPLLWVACGVTMALAAAAFLFLFLHREKIPKGTRTALVVMLLFIAASVGLQVLWPELLLSGAAMTVVTIASFFLVENPIERYRKHAFFDLAANIPNRNRYSVDMLQLDNKYEDAAAQVSFACVACDMNNLKEINDNYGHEAGDHFLHLAAAILQRELRSALGVYRTGGDEFTAIYELTDAAVIQAEIQAVHRACSTALLPSGQPMSLAIGAAFAHAGETVFQTAHRADQVMYQHKAERKHCAAAQTDAPLPGPNQSK
jgi:diguanylate cyclase (GGDEF)-like protein